VEVLRRLNYQAGAAIVWRDAITRWFTRESGIPDALGRVGHYPDRTEAEAMTLTGYTIVDVTPWETASGGKAVVCNLPRCTAGTTWSGQGGWYDISVQYFDLSQGHSRFSLSVAGHDVDRWTADDSLPGGNVLNGSTSTRRVVYHVMIHHGDSVQVIGQPDGPEKAPLDYLSIVPASNHEGTSNHLAP
jgi:alpha-glucuronidase